MIPSGFVNGIQEALYRAFPGLDPKTNDIKTNIANQTHKVLTTNSVEIPELTYSFGVDKNPLINDFFQKINNKHNQFQIKNIVEWINEGMHADKKKQSALQALRNIIRAAGNPQEMKSIYKMIEQHADHGYPVDDRWKTIEEFKDQENIVRIEVVKNTYDSLAFLESVTKTKLNTNNDDILYVVHLEHIPYEDEEKTMYAHQWTMDTVKALQTQYPETKYLLACSPLVDRFFSPEEIYAMQESFQHDTRIYRDGIAQGNLLIGDKVIRLGVKDISKLSINQ